MTEVNATKFTKHIFLWMGFWVCLIHFICSKCQFLVKQSLVNRMNWSVEGYTKKKLAPYTQYKWENDFKIVFHTVNCSTMQMSSHQDWFLCNFVKHTFPFPTNRWSLFHDRHHSRIILQMIQPAQKLSLPTEPIFHDVNSLWNSFVCIGYNFHWENHCSNFICSVK